MLLTNMNKAFLVPERLTITQCSPSMRKSSIRKMCGELSKALSRKIAGLVWKTFIKIC